MKTVRQAATIRERRISGRVRVNLPVLTFNAWLRFDVVRRLLTELKGDSFLEIGCGEGGLGAWLAARYDYIGYEPDRYSFEVAQLRIGETGSVVNAHLPVVPTGTFDLVGAFEVLEHIEYDLAALQSWLKWVTPDGHILLSVPAHPERFGAADRRVGHYRRYERGKLADLLQDAGFADPRLYTYGFPLGHVLEASRNWIAKRSDSQPADTIAERTAGSGRWLQPSKRSRWIPPLVTLPSRWIQRFFVRTTIGSGLIAVARRPQ